MHSYHFIIRKMRHFVIKVMLSIFLVSLGTLLLDLEAPDLTSIIHNVVENMVIRDLVEEEVKGKLLRTLLLKHK